MLEDDFIKIARNILGLFIGVIYVYPYHILIEFYKIYLNKLYFI